MQNETGTVTAIGDHYSLHFTPHHLGPIVTSLDAQLTDKDGTELDHFKMGLGDAAPFVQGKTNAVTVRSDAHSLTIWRNWLSLRAKLFDDKNEAVDNFELSATDIFNQLGIKAEDVMQGKVKLPGWLSAVLDFLSGGQ